MQNNSYRLRVTREAPEVSECEQLSQDDMWSTQGNVVWNTRRFLGRPEFYPVYNYRDLYSHSLLALLVLKGSVSVNRSVAKVVSQQGFLYFSGHETIDREITRIGGPVEPTFQLKDPTEYVHSMARALNVDTDKVEKAHPGFTNVILCGGKDSLNLLLLSWKNPVLVASASPNYELVKAFIASNGLHYKVIRLEDKSDQAVFDAEVLENCCRIDLRHARWGVDLCRLACRLDRQAVFWLGQMADVFTTPKWRKYRVRAVSEMLLARGARCLRRNLLTKAAQDRLAQRYFHHTVWYRGAMWQGTHASLVRQITDRLTLSAYHGTEMRRVFSRVDLANAVPYDIRPMIGECLAGRPVIYPGTNPGPPVSKARVGLAKPERFLKALACIGIRVSR